MKKFKIKNYFYPYKIYKVYRDLKKSEFASFDQLVEIQNMQLRLLVVHAYNHVPYYRELFDQHQIDPLQIKSIEDMELIPPLTKDIVRKRFNDLKADNRFSLKPYIQSTSGSTGSPLKFLLDKNVNIARFAFFLRVWSYAGYRPYLKWAQMDMMFKGDGNRLFKYNFLLNSLQLSSHSVKEEDLIRILKKLSAFKPKIIRGNPGAIYLLAKVAKETNFKLSWKLKSIITYSENLYPYQRELIEKVFNSKVFDVYTSWEAVCIIAECDQHNKHQQMEFSVMEILDENGKKVENGQKGEIVTTALHNYSMPFLRYKTGDIATLNKQECTCGRKHLAVKNIDGRKNDVILTPDGEKIRIAPSYSNDINFLKFTQIIQNSIDSFDVYLTIAKGFDDDERGKLEKRLRDYLGNTIRINFFLQNEITPESNGKIRFIKNNIINKDA